MIVLTGQPVHDTLMCLMSLLSVLEPAGWAAQQLVGVRRSAGEKIQRDVGPYLIDGQEPDRGKSGEVGCHRQDPSGYRVDQEADVG